MKAIITPNLLGGQITAIPSKSDAHRILIACALSDKKTVVSINSKLLSDDIRATLKGLTALGARFEYSDSAITVYPIQNVDKAYIDCGESGSTLRFLMPVACALCGNNTFIMHGRLAKRPIDELQREMIKNGCEFSHTDEQSLSALGRLKSGRFRIAGNISSQYITGLLFALPVLDGDSEIELTSPLQSSAYVDMTLSVLRRFGINILQCGNCFLIRGSQKYISPGKISVEGDWSNAAFWLCAGAVGLPVTVKGININSLQADKKITDILRSAGAYVHTDKNSVCVSPCAVLNTFEINAEQIPDIIPVIAVTALFANGKSLIYNAARLRIKESDRIAAISSVIASLGGKIRTGQDFIEITGNTPLKGSEVSGFNDHRIIMSAAIAAQYCSDNVTINDCEAINKSYPSFFEDYNNLGGIANVISDGK